MITGCCACPARSAAFRSKGFGDAARNGFMIASRADKRPHNRSFLLLNHDRPSHLRVNRAKIVVSAGSAGCNCELLICVERSRFLKLFLDAVWFGAVGALRLAAEREEGQIEKNDAAEERRHFIFGSECNHSLSRSS